MKRLYELHGDADALAAALDHVHLLCEVEAIVEGDGSARVLVDGELAALTDFAVTVRMLDSFEEFDAASAPTGFERDAVIEVADDLIVRPPWVESRPDFRGIELVVPRGMAFGSGEHGSTKAAMQCLRSVWPASGELSVLDVGTGSGILLLLARALGATSLCGCDIEPESVVAARELLPDADVRLGGPATFDGERFDVVIANLDGRQLHANLSAVRAKLRAGGTLVVSGMRPEEVVGLRDKLPSEAVRVERRECLGYVSLGYVSPR
ncbi:MAG: 50S ribosomal protein L11 methyltransferase [Planctomycetota bacterium]